MAMKLFVWDFHGVLEKDNDRAVLDISNRVLAAAGLAQRFSSEDNAKYYGLKWYEYFERLLPHLTHEEHLELQAACFAFMENNLHVIEQHIKPNDFAVEVLQAIRGAGHDQIVLSNTRPKDLDWFIHAVHLEEYFPVDKVVGVNAHQKHGNKQDALREYVPGKNFVDLVIVGDSASDMRLQEVAGGTTYLYRHPHLPALESVAADHSIGDLRKVLAEL